MSGMSIEPRELKLWSAPEKVLNFALIFLYSFVGFEITIKEFSIYILLLFVFLSLFFVLIRNKLVLKFQSELKTFVFFRNYWKNVLVWITFVQIVFGILFLGLGLSLEQAIFPVLVSIVFFSVPLTFYFDVLSDLGSAIFYFRRAMWEPFNLDYFKRGSKSLSNYLKDYGLFVSPSDLIYHINLVRISGKDVTLTLKEIVQALRNNDNNLKKILEDLLEPEDKIEKSDVFSWKTTLADLKLGIGKKEIGLIISILTVTILLLNFVYTNRPIVDYYLGFPAPNDYDVSEILNLNVPHIDEPYFEILANFKNRGAVDAPIMLIISLNNACFTYKDSDYTYLANDTVVNIYTISEPHQEDFKKFGLFIAPFSDSETFSVNYEIEQVESKDFYIRTLNYFLHPNPSDQIYLEFERIDEDSFERVK